MLVDIFGKLCQILLPISDELYYGNVKSSVAICTLSSMNLLKQIANSNLMQKIYVAGRLLSENKGVDSLVRHVLVNKTIKTILICGREVGGHKSGHSLISLYKNGLNNNHRIISSNSPNPLLTITQFEVTKFQFQVEIIDKIGETNFSKLKQIINSIQN